MQARRWFGITEADDAIMKQTLNSPSLTFALLHRYLDMVSRESEQLEPTEEQRLLLMDREERWQREHTRSKLSLQRKIEEVRNNKFKILREKLCSEVSFVNNFSCSSYFLKSNLPTLIFLHSYNL